MTDLDTIRPVLRALLDCWECAPAPLYAEAALVLPALRRLAAAPGESRPLDEDALNRFMVEAHEIERARNRLAAAPDESCDGCGYYDPPMRGKCGLGVVEPRRCCEYDDGTKETP